MYICVFIRNNLENEIVFIWAHISVRFLLKVETCANNLGMHLICFLSACSAMCKALWGHEDIKVRQYGDIGICRRQFTSASSSSSYSSLRLASWLYDPTHMSLQFVINCGVAWLAPVGAEGIWICRNSLGVAYPQICPTANNGRVFGQRSLKGKIDEGSKSWKINTAAKQAEKK